MPRMERRERDAAGSEGTRSVRGDDEIRDFVRSASEDAEAVRIVGRGSWLDAGSAVSARRTLSLAGDTGIVRYTPDDLTVTMRAGTTLREIDDALREHDQWLGLDPEGDGDVSIGATLATCSYGPSAALFGTPRDNTLGMTVVTGNAEIIRVGGRVVKNVAGFDVTRLMIGAWGTLGVITEATLRVRGRGLTRGAMDHMRRQYPTPYGYREPVTQHRTLSLALKARFDPRDILNRGIMVKLRMTVSLTPRDERGSNPIKEAQAGLDACVHCGFCLQACPTYLALEDENDSPRGRLVLMRALADDALPPTDEDLRTHIDRCLGCRACETACPSGVPYGMLLEATRATLRGGRAPGIGAQILLAVFERNALMKIAMWLARLLAATPIPSLMARLPGRAGFAMAMLAASEFPLERGTYAATGDGSRGTAALLRGCVMEGIFTETNRATERVLIQNGYTMKRAGGQGCCGALHAHAGDLDTARRLARRNIAAFERSGAEYIVSNAAGCGAIMKEYDHLLAADAEWSERARAVAARVRDVSELLAAAGPSSGGMISFKTAYDPPCHLLHAQRVVNAPLAMLEAIPGIQLVPLDEADQCCGSAGIYNLIEPETSNAVLQRKLECIHASGASLVATGNPGCLMQIGAGLLRADMRARAVHPVDLLDASYAGL